MRVSFEDGNHVQIYNEIKFSCKLYIAPIQ
jgi:hypothetical protein